MRTVIITVGVAILVFALGGADAVACSKCVLNTGTGCWECPTGFSSGYHYCEIYGPPGCPDLCFNGSTCPSLSQEDSASLLDTGGVTCNGADLEEGEQPKISKDARHCVGGDQSCDPSSASVNGCCAAKSSILGLTDSACTTASQGVCAHLTNTESNPSGTTGFVGGVCTP